MKLERVVALTSLLIVAAPAASAKALPVENYQLVWSDEFDGDTLDLDKWGYRSLGPRRDAVNVKETVGFDG